MPWADCFVEPFVAEELFVVLQFHEVTDSCLALEYLDEVGSSEE